MADELILTIETYGAQRVKHPTTGRQVSAYKIGYTSATAPLLLGLYGEQACDVSSRQSSYRYLQIDADPVVRHGYLLLTLTADELRQAEAIARRHHRAGAFL